MTDPGARARGYRGRWPLALLGLFLFVVSVVALSGPGRIDILDGQTRYEVARSMVEHGDAVVRNPEVTFSVFPGRDGRPYSMYRLPQSVLGAAAILLADATGPVAEARRQFFFAQTSAFACGLLAVAYALWFRRLGHAPGPALGWAPAGVFCTPCWFYGTSCFDDILGSTAVVVAAALAWQAWDSRSGSFAFLAGLAVGVAFHCKQPLGVFLLPVLALTVPPGERRPRPAQLLLTLLGLAFGLVAYWAYEYYKFPPGSTADHARLLEQYVTPFPGTPVAGFLVLLCSPAAGVFWYCPTLLLSLTGLVRWGRTHPLFTAAVVAASVVFTGFICCLAFFKGDPSWGPRYLTPVFALLWVFVPRAAADLCPRRVALVLGLGLLVQVLGLSVDYHRLYVELRFPSGFYVGRPWIYFHPRAAHLVHRPREIYELLTEDKDATTVFGPASLPTAAPPPTESMERGPQAVRKYRILNSFRPWWASQPYLAPSERPVHLGATLALFAGGAGLGLGLLAGALRPRGSRPREHPTPPFGVPCVPAGARGLGA